MTQPVVQLQRLLTLALSITAVLWTQVQSDENQVRGLVEKSITAHGRKDLSGLLSLWSRKSPHLETHKQLLEKQFAAENFRFAEPQVSRLKLEKDKASLQITVQLTATHLKTSEKRNERLVHNLDFVNEDGEWKIWRYAAAADDLAAGLVKAKSEAERAKLLSEQSELVTPQLTRALMEQTRDLFIQARYDELLPLYALVQTIAAKMNDHVRSAHVLSSIGYIHSETGDHIQALNYLRNSLALAESRNDLTGISRAVDNLGIVYSRQGDFSKALEFFQRALDVDDVRGDRSGTPGTLSNISIIHAEQGNYALAMEYLLRSFTMAEASGDKYRMVRPLMNIGTIHGDQGNYEQALQYFRRALAISEENKDTANVADLYNNIGLILFRQGKITESLDWQNKSLRLREEVGDKTGIAGTLSKIGEVYAGEGNLEKALEQYYRTVKIFEAAGHKWEMANVLTRMAEVWRKKGSSLAAIEHAERASKLAEETGQIDQLWQARLAAGNAHLDLHQPGMAREAFNDSIASIEKVRSQVSGGEQDQQRFFESRVSPYHAMVDLLAPDRPAEALAVAERAKSRVLLDVLSRGRINVTKAMTAQEQGKEQSLNSRLISLNAQIVYENDRPEPDQPRLRELDTQLGKARLEFEAFQTNLYSSHPELKMQRGAVQPFTFTEAGALVRDARTALLEFVVTEKKTFLFVLTKGSAVEIKVYALAITEKQLIDRVEQFRSLLANADNRFAKQARDLYDLLFLPAMQQLAGKKTLIIVPDGPLWELPVQALQTARSRYLIEDYTISYVPSLTVLRDIIRLRTRRATWTGSSTLLALGNPSLGKDTVARVNAVLMDAKLDPLPEAEHQVRALERIYGSGKSRTWTGGEAREDRFKSEAGNYRILHLATHGILNDRSPMYSHLLLAQTDQGGKEDGLLEAWELMKLDLKAELAVLSACETARGRTGKGEGMIGLTWALFVAGVPTSVVSQWKVRSDSTAELMIAFHRRLSAWMAGGSGSKSTAAALREAALEVRSDSKFRHPFHWAGFIVVGDGY